MDISKFKYTSEPTLGLLPPQKLSSKLKGKEWREDCVNAIISKSYSRNGTFNNNQRTSSYNKQINYNLVNSIFDERDFEYVLDPYGLGSNFNLPERIQEFNIVRPKIEVLKGEEIKRPFNFMAVGTAGEVLNAKLQYKEKIFKESFEQFVNMELSKYGLAQPEVDDQGNPIPPKTPKQVEDFINYSYNDIREKYTNDILKYLVPFLKLQDKFNLGWEHALIAGEEIYYTSILDDEPFIRVVNPLFFDYDKTIEMENIEDASWCCEERWMSSSQVIDEYGEFLTDEEIELIDRHYLGSPLNNYGPMPGFAYSPDTTFSNNNFWYTYNNYTNIRVMSVAWKSLTRIGFATYIDEFGESVTKMVTEDFKLPPELKNKVTIEWRWINETWSGVRIGDSIYVNIKPLDTQVRSIDNPTKAKLPYVGKIYNATNSRSRSIVDLLKPHQYTYTVVWFRLLMELAKAKGKKMVVDIAQIPKSHGIDFNKWMYYFDNMGIGLINSLEEGREGDPNSISKFNQFTSIDMSLSNVVGQYMEVLHELEAMAGELVGITRQREGQVNTTETVGNVERSIVQSSTITEHLFYKHDQVKQAVLTRMVELAKIAYKNGKKSQYVLDDGIRIFLDIDSEGAELIRDSDIGVFINNSSQDALIKSKLEGLSHAAIQNDSLRLSSLIKIMKSNSIAETEKTLLRGEEEKIQREEQARQQELEVQQMIQERQIAWEREKLDRESAEKQLDREAKLRSEEIKAMSFAKDTDLNKNGIPDVTEQTKLSIDQLKNNTEALLKQKELELKNKEIDSKQQIELLKAQTALKVAKENKNKYNTPKKKK